jgi:membrane protein DedA with SNARE-associated domain
MGSFSPLLVRHGYLLIFCWVLVEQLGLPIPSLPILLAAGALAGVGQLNLGWTVALSVVASLASDASWFFLGRKRGGRVLGWLCRISLEPDSCVRRTEEIYVRHGARSLLVAKFIPGLATVAPPLAGIFRMRLSRFLAFDSAGALAWAGSYIVLGYVFSRQLEQVADYAGRLGVWLVILLILGLAGFIAWKFAQRQKFLHDLRIARISPAELKHMVDAGENVLVVDLRHSLDFEADPESIPGAVHLDPDDVDQFHSELPRDREIILYCT